MYMYILGGEVREAQARAAARHLYLFSSNAMRFITMRFGRRGGWRIQKSKFSALKWYLIVHYAVRCSLHAIVYSVASINCYYQLLHY